jgi:hypothetical protein
MEARPHGTTNTTTVSGSAGADNSGGGSTDPAIPARVDDRRRLPCRAPQSSDQPLAWGKKVTPDFKKFVIQMAVDFRCPEPDWFMACMAFETIETFRPDIRPKRKDGSLISTAVGLIQFLEKHCGVCGNYYCRARGDDRGATAAVRLEVLPQYDEGGWCQVHRQH